MSVSRTSGSEEYADAFGGVEGLPEEVRRQISDLRRMTTVDSNNAFYHGRLVSTGTPVVVKQFWAPPPNLATIWQLWRTADTSYIARLLLTYPDEPTDRVGTYCIEVTEFLEHGSLAAYTGNSAGRLSDADAHTVLDQVTTALEYLHGVTTTGPPPERPRLVHGDIKPSNLLVRRTDPLELRLTDFGIAQVVTGQPARAVRMTYSYAPPEAETDLSPAADWFSLGITMLELIQGRHPWVNPVTGRMMPRREISAQMLRRGVDFTDAPQHWHDVILGLTHYHAEERWNHEDVRNWRNGKVRYTDHHTGPSRRALHKLTFAGATYQEPAALGRAMGEHWTEAARLLVGVEAQDLIEWCRTVSPGLADHVSQILRQHERHGDPAEGSSDRLIARVIARLAPSGTPLFMGHVVTTPGLLDLSKRAGNGDRTARRVIDILLKSRGLREYGILERFRVLDNIDEVWRGLHGRAATLSASVLTSQPVPPDLAAVLLRTVLDETFSVAVIDRGKEIASSRANRYHPTFEALRSYAEQHARDGGEIVVYSLIALAGNAVPRPPAPDAAGSTSPVGARGVDDPLAWLARLDAEFTGIRPAPTRRRRRRPAERWRPHRTPTERRRLAVKLGAAVGCSAALTAVTGLGIAERTSVRQGALVATALLVAGACLALAVTTEPSRLSRTLLGLWAGTVIGAVLATMAAGVVSTAIDPRSGWPVFWISWMGVVMMATARGATR